MTNSIRFARYVFLVAGIYGLAVLLPQYFLEDMVNRQSGRVIAHPEYFYGFVGVATAWQVAFIFISRDVIRFRLLMLPAILEKLAFGCTAVALYLQQRVTGDLLAAGLLDLVIGIFFVAAFHSTRDSTGG